MLYDTMREQDPTALPGAVDVIAEIAATVASQLLAQTQATQRTIRTLRDEAVEYSTDFVVRLVAEAKKDVNARIRRTSVAPAAGDGALLMADDWAGPVAGPTLIETRFGIPRSTLYRWQKRNEAIALNTRTSRKPVFPLRQFVDGRPVDGLPQLVTIFGSQRNAWQWLIKPQPALGGASPLDLVLGGELQRALNLASRAQAGVDA